MKKLSTNSDDYYFIGSSNEIKKVFEIINKIAHLDVNILITGESGTGKELVARSIYNKSHRKDGPFIVVNCAAIPDSLVESELFGHEKGAFTGAEYKRKGKFELAHKGTLFLDEIGDMDIDSQAKLLRIIEEKKFETIGGERQIVVDTRIIAATNKDLHKKVKEGTFREDLFYRLHEVSIEVPPLRERTEDIPILIDHFMAIYNREFNKNVKEVSGIAKRYLNEHQWPGNVRQLKNVIKRAIALIETDIVWLEHLGFEVRLNIEDEKTSEDESLQEVEKRHIQYILDKTNWHKTKAASILKISRHRLDRKIKSFGFLQPKL